MIETNEFISTLKEEYTDNIIHIHISPSYIVVKILDIEGLIDITPDIKIGLEQKCKIEVDGYDCNMHSVEAVRKIIGIILDNQIEN